MRLLAIFYALGIVFNMLYLLRSKKKCPEWYDGSCFVWIMEFTTIMAGFVGTFCILVAIPLEKLINYKLNKK